MGAFAQTAPACPSCLDDLVRVEFSGLVLNRSTGTFDTLARVTNISGRPVYAPLRLAVRSISVSGVSLANAAGTTAEGWPYVDVPLPAEILAPGQKVENVVLRFANPKRVAFNIQATVQGLRVRAQVQAPAADPGALALDAEMRKHVVMTVYTFAPRGSISEVRLFVTGRTAPLLLRDDGQGVDGSAGDGIYAGELDFDTTGMLPDDCFVLRAEALADGQVVSSPESKLCATQIPIGAVAPSEGPGSVVAHPDAANVQVISDQALATFVEDTTEQEIQNAAVLVGAQVVGSIPRLGVYQLRFNTLLTTAQLGQRLAQLRAIAKVRSVEPNALMIPAGQPQEIPNEYPGTPQQAQQDLATQQPALAKVGLPEAWKAVKAQPPAVTGQILAVVDSGVFLGTDPIGPAYHPDLAGAGVTGPLPGWKCFTTGLTTTAAPCVSETPVDPYGHGTAVAGIAAALTDNNAGVAGASWNANPRIRSLRIMNDTTSGSINKLDFYQAMDKARTQPDAASVVNVSSGIALPSNCDTLTQTQPGRTSAVVDQVLVVAAAGNGGSSGPYYPAYCPGVLGVANTTDTDALYNVAPLASNYGVSAAIAAPGTNIKSTSVRSGSLLNGVQYWTPGQDYGSFTGTSFAAPLVSGIAILLKTLDPSLTVAGLRAMLIDKAGLLITVPSGGNANLRRVDACAAVLFTKPSLLAYDPGYSSTGTISENETYAPATMTTPPRGEAGRLMPSCDNVTYTVESVTGVSNSGNVLLSAPLPFMVERRVTGTSPNQIIEQVLRLVSNTSLNFEQYTSYQLTVKMEVNGGSSATPPGATATRTLTVNVTNANERPTDIALNPSSVNENVPVGTTVGTFSTTDPDAGNTFTYALVPGTGSTDNASFSIAGNTLRINVSPDFETKSSYSIRVSSTDQGTLSFEKVFTISVINVNEPPTDIALNPSSVNENVPVGTTVGTFSTTDPDAGNTFTYALVPGTGSTDNASFSIAGNTLKINVSPDFETKTSYSIRVSSTDQGTLSFEKVFTISIGNVNEPPTDIALSPSSVNENVLAGTTVGTFSTTDPDAGNTFTYVLVPGTGSTDNASFSIVGNTLKINVSPDFETKSSYSIRVSSTDQGTLSFEKVFTISVLNMNEPPVNTVPAGRTVAEDTALSFTGANAISVNDVDGNLAMTQLTVSNGTLTVNLAGGATINAGANGTATLRLAGTQSQINAALLTLAYQGVADFNGSDTLTVVSTDSGSPALSATSTVPITINAVADIVPDTLTTSEDTPITANLITGTNGASADNFENAARAISSVTQGTNGSVTFTPAGSVTYTPNANFNGVDSFTYTVSSGGVTETAQVTVNVTSVNDAPTGANQTRTIAQNTSFTFGTTAFGFADVDGDALGAVRIDTLSLPTGSTLRLSGANVAALQVIPAGSLTSLVFTPAPNATGTNYASFTFRVRDASLFSAAPNTFTFDVSTIIDNDVPTISINAQSSAVEGNDVVFTVVRTGSPGPVSVSYATAILGGNTATPGTDFTPVSGTLTFAAGEVSRTISVPTAVDGLDEGNETFGVVLSNPTGGAVLNPAASSATGTIIDGALVVAPQVTRTGQVQIFTLTTGPITSTSLVFNDLVVGGARINPSTTLEYRAIMEFGPIAVPAGAVISSARLKVGAPHGDANGGAVATGMNVIVHGYSADLVPQTSDLLVSNAIAGVGAYVYNGATFTQLPPIDVDVTSFVQGLVSGGSVSPGFLLRPSPVPTTFIAVVYPPVGAAGDLAPRLEIRFSPGP